MASQTLETIIAINAKVGNGFSAVGATLTELGSIVNGASQGLINFGKDSAKVYRDYEKSMTDAEIALSTKYGRKTTELAKVMKNLDVTATQWAATTIFHTNDVANAISEAAHAGWDYEKIMTGLPAAMQLAQAGGLDLSEAVNYIVKSTNAAGISFEDLGNFIDLWTYAANSSASTIGEFGDVMLRMGSTMRFAGNTEELMTLIAVTANAGAVGGEAGTMIRNSMMRLIAPTDKAKKAMAQLGATSNETAALMNDESLAAANAELAAHGFSAFYQDGPNKGQMKNVLDIYRELYVALGDIAGGYDNIDRNGKALEVLSSIFPTRTITEALNLLRSAAAGYDGLYESMRGGDAAGYGQYAAETEMDTLYGKMETFESKVERLKQLVGEELSGQIGDVMGSLGGIVDKIAELPEDQFSALVSGLEVIAMAGPGLLLAGGAFRLIGHLLTPAGGIGLGLVALTAAAAAIKQLEEADFADNFGNMELDTEGIKSYVKTLGEDFKAAYSEVDKFKNALDQSVESYQTASSTFSAKLFESMITNAKLSDTDIAALEKLGQNMFLAVQGAITNSTAASVSYWQTLFGGEGTAEYDPVYQQIYDLTNQAYADAIAQASAISKDLRDAMTSAFEDREVTDEEYQNILSFMQSYNDAMARAAAEAKSEEDYIKMQKWLKQAQTASLSDIKGIAETATAERDQILAEQDDRFLTEYYRLQYRGADAETLARAEARHEAERQKTSAAYDEFLYTLWDSQLQQSGQAGNLSILAGYAQQYMSGQMTGDEINAVLRSQMGRSAYAGEGLIYTGTDRAQLGRMLGYMVAGLGGTEGLQERIGYYQKTGNNEMAERLSNLLVMEQLINNFGTGQVVDVPSWNLLGSDYNNSNELIGVEGYEGQENRGRMDSMYWSRDFTLEAARNTVGSSWGSGNKSGLQAWFNNIGRSAEEYTYGYILGGRKLTKEAEQQYQTLFSAISQNYDLDRLLAESSNFLADKNGAYRYDYAMWEILFGEASKHAEDYRITVPVTPDVEGMEPVPIPVKPKVEGQDAMTSLQEQGVTVDVGADDTELQATIDGADGQKLIEYLNGDATDLHMVIMGEDGKVLTEIVKGDATALAAAIARYNGMTITVKINGQKMFAEGGRATSASIFGEAGPEWAIPEEHSERTAELLNAARAASGFTWPDILARFGGLNANANHAPTTIIYSPTINATDATGVEQVLREDKKRLDKWFEEKKMRDDVEVYA